jgi:hypothetical protein
MFARLNDARPPSAGPDKAIFTFEDGPEKLNQATVLKSYIANLSNGQATIKITHPKTSDSPMAEQLQPAVTMNTTPPEKIEEHDEPNETMEHKYLTKASEYLDSLPTSGKATTAELVKNVAAKLRRPYTCIGALEPDAAEALTGRYLAAVATYCNELGRQGATKVTTDFVKQALKKSDGNFLQLCGALVEENALTIDSLDEVVGLCKAVAEILPKDVKSEAASVTASTSTFKDPMDKLTAWPTQEKRENGKSLALCESKPVY